MSSSSKFPRDIAVRVLTRVLSDREPLDEALAAAAGEVSPQARAWLLEVCAGTLRWKGRLDWALDSTALKKKPTGWLRKVLLIAAYQLIAQDRVVAGAVVSETVDEVRRKEGEAPAKFANACLRKVSEHAARWRALELRGGAKLPEAAAWASVPEWLWKKLVAEQGESWASSYALASLERPALWLRFRDPGALPAWAKAGPLPGSAEGVEGGAVFEKAGFREGEFFVQDISSQALVSGICGRVKDSIGGPFSALDLCAAPGGKSIGMAWSGAQVVATDRDETRMALLRGTVERVGQGRVRVIPRSEVPAQPPFDLVWVDAPCTGTGILRRHPDVRWLRRENELGGLLKVQRELLDEAWTRVRPGGFLAYSVCSVLREEGPSNLKSLLARQEQGAELVQEWFLTPQEPPHGDGFWAGLIRKKLG